MTTVSDVVVVRGEQELFDRAGHLFEGVTDMACAANDLHTWSVTRPHRTPLQRVPGKRIRKIYRPGVLLDPSGATHLREVQDIGATIRITRVEINETILLDRRIAILAGDLTDGVRSYSVITSPETVQGVLSLFEAVWSAATELAVYDARIAEIRLLAPQILELLASGCKDETAARTLGLGVRTYRRRVAELMAALDASSRFQAGARARDLGLL
jgi:DNA-binding NarL/FixJ family response regulator